jgi:hypothetical protein
MSNNKVINAWEWDVRVRERNMKKEVLTEKDLEKRDAQLVDLADQCEPVGVSQPALGGREP